MRFFRWTGAALLCLLVAALFWQSLRVPYAGFDREAFVDFPKGTGSRAVSGLLAGAGVIRHRWQFLAIRLLRPRARLQAGEYRFQKPATVWEVFDRLARGDVFYYDLSVHEGHNLFDIAASLDELEVIPGAEFLRVARDPAPIRDLAPRAPTLEGYLFPDTYRVARHTTAEQLCRQMTDRFRQNWRQLGATGDVHDVVTLASLVEKEARLPEERPLIASVFLNRLRLRMPLQCDPTTIYAAQLEDKYRGAIYRSDLDRKHRYNTYQNAGLPPGPIANPGLQSLRAALRPAETGYIYFVVRPDGSGAHQFSKDLAQHERAVQKYRRGNGKTLQARATPAIPGPRAAGGNRRNGTGRSAAAARAHF